MSDSTTLGISFKYESRTLFRNVRPVDDILEDFKKNDIPHIHIDPEEMKYGSWNLIVAFAKQENYDLFKAGKIFAADMWQTSDKPEQRSVNPLKAAKRAATGG